ncbi:MAG: 2-oxo acid dehydrogenase subunit E2 [Pseudomonadota bacterium]
MHKSLADSAQLSFTASFNADRLLIAAKQLRADCDAIRVQDVVSFCYAQQLATDTLFNATLEDGILQVADTVNLGFALALPTHLVVPVIRAAATLSMAELAMERRRLTDAALGGTLAPADMQGATSTVSNLGRGRVEAFTPILNAPEVALLGVAAIQARPWVGATNTLVVAPVGALSLTVDHRVIDGAPANAFLSALCERLEQL